MQDAEVTVLCRFSSESAAYYLAKAILVVVCTQGYAAAEV